MNSDNYGAVCLTGSKMKKIIIIILSAVMLTCLCSCGESATTEGATKESLRDGTLDIVCTIFPAYDWIRHIMGGEFSVADVKLLLDGGMELHSFQPTAEDMITVSQCDLFIYVGGASDSWVPGVLSSSGAGCRTLSLMDTLSASVLEEETVEGMQAGSDAGGAAEYDEHVWLSLKNAAVLCDALCEVLSELDPDSAAVYRANTDEYKSQILALDGEFAEFVRALDGGRPVLFGDRFPFRYFTEDYNIDYYAAFSGCSADSEASFETVSFLAGKMDEYRLEYIFDLEDSENGLAETIVNSTADKQAEILTLDSMQSVTMEDVASGADYLEIMRENCMKFETALEGNS